MPDQLDTGGSWDDSLPCLSCNTVANTNTIGPGEMWIGFGTGKDFRYITIHDIAANLPLNMCEVLPLIHALTECDTVSSFYEKGKKTAWETWKAFPPAHG